MAAAADKSGRFICTAVRYGCRGAWPLAIIVALSGCGGGGSLGSGSPSTGATESSGLSLPKLADIPAVAAITTPAEPDPEGSATELYTRIARGAVGCWFGASGPLKKDYIYHAEADAPSRGGKAEIIIHVRDPSQANPRGMKAYRIKIEPKNEANATVTTENLKMPEVTAATMAADVGRWSRGDQGCQGASTAVGWTAEAGAPEQAKTAPPAKTKAKAPVKAPSKNQP